MNRKKIESTVRSQNLCSPVTRKNKPGAVKKILLSFALLGCVTGASAQEAAETAAPDISAAATPSTGDYFGGLTRPLTFDRMIPPYALEVTFNKTTHVIFPSAIRYVERNLEIARQLDNKRLTYLSNMYLAQLYSFSGMCVEANQILRSIRSSELPRDLLPVYYEANNRYFQHYATLSSQRSHLHEMNIYRDSLMMVSDPGSFRYRIHLSYKLMGNGKMDEARAILDELLEEVGKDTPLYAETAYAYGYFYRLNKDPEAGKKYFMLSAIADAKSAVKENASFRSAPLTGT